ncbi:trimethylamine methyltransferase, partial [Candidatus Bathyarchaeota archaeon]
DAEALANVRAYWRTFSIDEETLAIDVIKKVGPGGNFLGLKHTLEHFQKEIWLKKRTAIPSPTDGSQIERAKEKVKKILKEHSVPPLDEDAQKELNNIIKRAEKELLKTTF